MSKVFIAFIIVLFAASCTSPCEKATKAMCTQRMKECNDKQAKVEDDPFALANEILGASDRVRRTASNNGEKSCEEKYESCFAEYWWQCEDY